MRTIREFTVYLIQHQLVDDSWTDWSQEITDYDMVFKAFRELERKRHETNFGMVGRRVTEFYALPK